MADENEKKDSSAVGNGNSPGGKAKNLERAYKTAKKTRLLVTALATSEIWVPIVVIGLIIVVIIIVLFGGFSSNTPNTTPCSDITSNSQTASAGAPVTLTINNCSANSVFSWSALTLNGTFNPTNTASTVYTPPTVAANTAITIIVNVCSSTVANACSQYGTQITVTPATCKSLGGTCTSKNICGAEGRGAMSGSNDCVSPTVCCNLTPSFRFLCQYGPVNSNGVRIGGQTWNTNSCDITGGGCGATTVAMILDSFTGSLAYTPTQVALANGGAGCSSTIGSDTSSFRSWITRQGFRVTGDLRTGGRMLDLGLVRSFLQQGYYVYGQAHISWQDSNGTGNASRIGSHAIAITAINGSNLTIYDPTYCVGGKAGGLRVLRDVNNLGRGDVGSLGWYSTVAIIKN